MEISSQLDVVLDQDEQPVTVTIYQPDGSPYLAKDGTEATMSLLGVESKRVQRVQDANLRRFVGRQGRNVGDEVRQDRVAVATAGLVAWHGWELDGKPADLTPENVAKVFRVQHILQQAEEVMRLHGRFFKPASPT